MRCNQVQFEKAIYMSPFSHSSIKATFLAIVCAATFIATPSFASQSGKASWYAMTSRTASGERASPNTMTAAHRTLRFGTHIKVTNLRNGRAVILCVNDRGPFVRGRVVDVTKRAAKKLGFLRSGWTRVRVDVTGKRTRGCG